MCWKHVNQWIETWEKPQWSKKGLNFCATIEWKIRVETKSFTFYRMKQCNENVMSNNTTKLRSEKLCTKFLESLDSLCFFVSLPPYKRCLSLYIWNKLDANSAKTHFALISRQAKNWMEVKFYMTESDKTLRDMLKYNFFNTIFVNLIASSAGFLQTWKFRNKRLFNI